ncbi:MAG: DUF58 domain-containing protein [Phycisphaerales bacterium]|nr:DUF58 domain-containing protein [Phycisphaerales bacterium]
MEELISPSLLQALERLDVSSRRLFAGRLPGERRSKRRGQSVEFDDFRPYVAGDDLRHIDWNVFARLDRFVLKVFREDEDLSVDVILDDSASMGAGTPDKLVFAARLAMGVSSVALLGRNRLRVHALSGRSLAPMRGRRHLPEVARFLIEHCRSDRRVDLRASVMRIASTTQGRGVVVFLSDMLTGSEMGGVLSPLAALRGFDTWVLHIVAPDEVDPGEVLRGDLRLEDVETGRAVEMTMTRAALRRYRERFETHGELIRRMCHARSMSYLRVSSDADASDLLARGLRASGLFG